MSKQSDKKENSKRGRPTLYKEEFVAQAFNYCLLGATDVELAKFFDVQESTINNWKSEHPEFLESIKKGKELADAEIARRLFDRAKGAIINSQQAFKIKCVSYNDKGNRIETESIEVIDLKQEQPPDTTAAIFWLKNRSGNWKDKKEVDANIEVKPMTKELARKIIDELGD